MARGVGVDVSRARDGSTRRRKVVSLALTGVVGVGITWVRNGSTDRRKALEWTALLSRRRVNIGKVSVVVGLALARRVSVGVGRVRNGSIGGRNASPRGRMRGIGRARMEALGRRTNKGPLVRRWRECEGSRKADKNECRYDFQLHIVSFF